jgi:hypothetical protein
MLLRLITIASFALTACTDAEVNNDPEDPDCESIAGRWDIDGPCGDDTCTITQTGCGITGVTCTSGARSTTGSIEGNAWSYSGVSGLGVPATCSGTLSGDSLTGSCRADDGTVCAITGDRN